MNGYLLTVIRPGTPQQPARTVAEAVCPGRSIHEAAHALAALLNRSEHTGEELILFQEEGAQLLPGDLIDAGATTYVVTIGEADHFPALLSEGGTA